MSKNKTPTSSSNDQLPLPNDLTQGPIHKHLIRMALPILLGIFSTMTFALADTYFLGKLGGQELAAMGFITPIIMIIIAASIGLNAGTMAVLAPAYGEKNHTQVREYATNSFILSILIALFFSLIGFLSMDPLFTLMGADAEVMVVIKEYMNIWYFTTIFSITPMVAMGAMRAAGDTKIQSYIMILASVFNFILDPILIFGLFGFPKMGVEGAAITTLITRGFSFIAVLYFLFYKYKMLEFSSRVFAKFKESTQKIMHVGIPAMGTNIIIPISSAIIISIVAKFGADAVAGTNVAIRIETTIIIFFYALSAVIGPLIGQNLGAGKIDRIEEALRLSALFCFGFGILLALFTALFGGIIAREIGESTAISDLATNYLYIVPISYGAYGFVMAANAAYNSIREPLPAVYLSTLRTVILMLPLCYIAAEYFGLMVLFAAISLSNFIAGIIAIFWIRRSLKRLRDR